MGKMKKDPDFNLVRDTFDRRTDLHVKMRNPLHRTIISGMMMSSRQEGDHLFEPWWTADRVLERIDAAVMESELYAVTSDMMDLVVHASESLPPQSLEAVDLPSPAGYMSMATPYTLSDLGGIEIPHRTLVWRTEELGHDGVSVGVDSNGDPLPFVTQGIVVYMFVDSQKESFWKEWSPVQRAELPMDGLIHVQTIPFGLPSWSVEGGTGRRRLEMLRKMKSSSDMGWADQRVKAQLEEWERTGSPPTPRGVKVTLGIGDSVYYTPDPFVQFLKSAFHFIKSELTDSARIFPPRSSLKGLGPKVDWSPVTVVRLRRHVSDGPHFQGTGGKLSYRYVRRGHWRRQWCGPKDNRYQRYTWISPTIVGDAKLPFRQRSVVNLLQQ